MIAAETIKFLKKLKEHNQKEWMDQNRKDYERAKQDFEVFVDQLLMQTASFEPAFKELKAKSCIFRINRDIRFSNNKAPYKTNFGASFSEGGKKSPNAGYYFHLEPGASFIGGGIWMPETAALRSIRQEIDYNLEEWEGILKQKDFKRSFPQIEGELLKKAPQGYATDNPAIEYLRLKSFTVGAPLSDKELSGKGLAKQVAASYKIMKPFIDFLNKSLQT